MSYPDYKRIQDLEAQLAEARAEVDRMKPTFDAADMMRDVLQRLLDGYHNDQPWPWPDSTDVAGIRAALAAARVPEKNK